MSQSKIGRWLAVGAAAVAAAAVGLLVGPLGPAFAAGTPTRFEATSPLNTDATKSVTVACPGTSRVFAAGGKVIGGGGRVVLRGVVPDGSLTSVTVLAQARVGHTGTWALTAYAVCDTSPVPPVLAPPSTPAGPDMIASCPVGRRVYGTGFLLQAATDKAFVNGVVPNAALTQVRVSGVRAGDPSAVLTAYAICHLPVPGLRRVTGPPTSFDGTWPKTATAGDPTSDAAVYGVGGRVQGTDEVLLDALVPDPVDHTTRVQAALAIGPGVGDAARRDAEGDDEGSVTAYTVEIGTICGSSSPSGP
jgi:hypothetical protein